MTIKIGVISLGCPKNLVDSEIMLGKLEASQYIFTGEKENADVLIVNTCGFIDSAKQESINTILEMAECKKDKCKLLIVTGCLAERYNEQLMKEIPEIDAILGTGNYSEINAVIQKAFEGNKSVIYGKLDDTEYLEGNRMLTTNTGFSYVKIAEGCDNFCTYCIIPSLRGRYRSRKLENIVEEVRNLADNKGIKEIILVAQDTTRYGLDIYKERKLVELIKQISSIENVKWIRLLYCYPEEIDIALIEEIRDNPKVCKYLDIPIQHASDNVLKAMGRRGKSAEIRKLLKELRKQIPTITIRTSLIVGFPGETDEDFDLLAQFVETSRLDRVGVFTYSKEEGTAAAKMKNQVPKRLKEKRYKQIMKLQQGISIEKNEKRLGKMYEVIVQGVAEDGIFYFGRTYAEAPDIDGLVYFTSSEPLEKGQFVNIKILNIDQYDLIGEVINESAQ